MSPACAWQGEQSRMRRWSPRQVNKHTSLLHRGTVPCFSVFCWLEAIVRVRDANIRRRNKASQRTARYWGSFTAKIECVLLSPFFRSIHSRWIKSRQESDSEFSHGKNASEMEQTEREKTNNANLFQGTCNPARGAHLRDPCLCKNDNDVRRVWRREHAIRSLEDENAIKCDQL